MFHFRLCDLRLFYGLDPYREVNMHVDYSFNWLTFNDILESLWRIRFYA